VNTFLTAHQHIGSRWFMLKNVGQKTS